MVENADLASGPVIFMSLNHVYYVSDNYSCPTLLYCFFGNLPFPKPSAITITANKSPLGTFFYFLISLFYLFDELADHLIAVKYLGGCLREELAAIKSTSWSIRNNRSNRLPVSTNSLQIYFPTWCDTLLLCCLAIFTYACLFMYFAAITLFITKVREGLCSLTASLEQKFWLSLEEHQKV